MKQPFTVLLLAICLGSLTLSITPTALADRGMVPIDDVSVYGPGQKAIIAWDGNEEILILSTDVRASGDSQVLEILPLPSQPGVKQGNFTSFEQIERLIQEHFPIQWWDRFGKGRLGPAGEGIEIVFHEKIGAHNITVVKADDVAQLIQWAEEFLEGDGIEHQISSPRLEAVIQSYIAQDINFFVFDLIEVSSEPKSIEPIAYRFDTDFLYYPLRISTLASGWTDINLFLLTPQPPNLHWLPWRSQMPPGLEIGKYYDRRGTQPVQFQVSKDELALIDEDIADLLGGSAWLTAMTYHGDLAGLTRDLKLYGIPAAPELMFDYYQGQCAAGQKSQAIIGIFGNAIVAYGVVSTPTPCYELEAKLDFSGALAYPPSIVIDIAAKAKSGSCVQCIGEVPFRARVEGLAPGIYKVIIRYEGEVVGHRIVAMPPFAFHQRSELPPESIMKIVFTPEGDIVFGIDGKLLDSGTIVKAQLKGADNQLHLAYLQIDENTGQAIIAINNTLAIFSIAQDSKLRIEDSQLFVDSNYGVSQVQVMPDQAVSRVGLDPTLVELKLRNDKIVYNIQGVSHKKLLGLVSREIELQAQVDAADGKIIEQQKPWWARFCW